MPKRRVSECQPDGGLGEIKKRISDQLYHLDPESSFSKELNQKIAGAGEPIQSWQRKDDDQDIDNSDPRLIGWEPCDLGICGPKGSKFTIERIDAQEGGFAIERACTVYYNIELPSGENKPGRARFTKRETPYVYDVGALRAYLENAIGEDIFDYCDKLDRPYDDAIERHGSLENMSGDERSALIETIEATREKLSPNIPEPYLKEVIRPLHYHLDCMQVIAEILEPLGKEGGLLLKAIENRINFIFSLAIEIRQKELEGLHLSDALRGKAVISGSNRGGHVLAKRNSAHAKAWKKNFGLWLQRLLLEPSHVPSKRRLSRDGVIDLAISKWPKEGFSGLPELPWQKAIPSRQTLLNAIKSLEKSGIIKRGSSPPGGDALGN